MATADDNERIEVRSIADLHVWLRRHHRQSESVWLVTWKKASDAPYIPRRRILEALLSYGWIDSLTRKLDDERTMLLIARRQAGSSWSKVNREIAEDLMAGGQMNKAGQAAVDRAKQDGSWDRLDEVETLTLPRDLAVALRRHPRARELSDRFPPSSRRGILERIQSAKRPETRARRITETAEKAAKNIKANHPKGRDRGPAPSGQGKTEAPMRSTKKRATQKHALLSGGNPQIPKGDGYEPVQGYIAAMPGWKRDVGRDLDALIERIVARVRKAVRWNSPSYGVEGQGWFLSFHCFAKYVKVTLHNGASLKPLPLVESKHPNVRYFHIHEGEGIDETLLGSWIKQAAALPGEELF